MIVTKKNKYRYCIFFAPFELQAFQTDIDDPLDWDVKNLATLIKYILQCHLEEIDSRQKAPYGS